MIDYFKLIAFPSRFIEKLNTKNQKVAPIFLIWILAMFGMTLSKNIIDSKTSGLGFAYYPAYIFIIMILFYPVVYGLSYLYWIVGKGFKGISKFIDIRNSFIFSLLPFVFYLPISILFIIVGLINSDNGVIVHENYISAIILGLLSFRILITGIAKFNKFGWIISILNWFIVIITISGIYYLIRY